MLEQPLHDLEHIFQGLVRLPLSALHVHLEEGDGPREIGCDAVVQLARDAGPFPRHGIFDRLVSKAVSGRLDLLSRVGHRALARRLASDSSRAIASGWRTHRKMRS